MKNKGQSVPREGKDMSNFNDLYDHVAADRTRAIQLLGIQDIRCVKIGCLIGTYVGPELTLVAWKRK